jgi:hypothetical protein
VELRPAQQLQLQQWNYDLHNSYSYNKFTRHSSGCLRSLPETEQDLFLTDYFLTYSM